MPIQYDRSIGANVYAPENLNADASSGNAMQAIARALGFYNDQSDLGTAAMLGGQQAAMPGLMGLLAQEKQAEQIKAQKDLMAMQQGGQAAIANARLQAAQEQGAAQRDMTKWSKQGDWNRYDKQIQAQKELAGSKSMQQIIQKLFGIKSAEDIAKSRNKSTLDAAKVNAQGRLQGAQETMRQKLLLKRMDILMRPPPNPKPEEMMRQESMIKKQFPKWTPQQISVAAQEAYHKNWYEGRRKELDIIDAQLGSLGAGEGQMNPAQSSPSMGSAPGSATTNSAPVGFGSNPENPPPQLGSVSAGLSQLKKNFPNAGNALSTSAIRTLNPSHALMGLLGPYADEGYSFANEGPSLWSGAGAGWNGQL
jgi:hypothetical protein